MGAYKGAAFCADPARFFKGRRLTDGHAARETMGGNNMKKRMIALLLCAALLCALLTQMVSAAETRRSA